MSSLRTASIKQIRELAARLCGDHLAGQWKTVIPDDIVVRRLNGGLSNYLYYVGLPKSAQKAKLIKPIINTSQTEQSATVPNEVILHIYGDLYDEQSFADGTIKDTVIFLTLSERNFGPKLYGIFPGGRIQKYIQGRTLNTRELADPKLSEKIAQKMAEMHSTHMPLSKEPDWMWSLMERWFTPLDEILARSDWGSKTLLVHEARKFDFRQETAWLRSVINQGNHKVVFSHNDTHEGNMILDSSSDDRESTEPVLQFIDFEYCAYNYRGFDIANHFIEWTYDYSNPFAPYFNHYKHQYPTKEQRERFYIAYLRKMNENVLTYTPTQQELNALEEEVRLLALYSHLFWSTCTLVNALSPFEYGYWESGVNRMREYQLAKSKYERGCVKSD